VRAPTLSLRGALGGLGGGRLVPAVVPTWARGFRGACECRWTGRGFVSVPPAACGRMLCAVPGTGAGLVLRRVTVVARDAGLLTRSVVRLCAFEAVSDCEHAFRSRIALCPSCRVPLRPYSASSLSVAAGRFVRAPWFPRRPDRVLSRYAAARGCRGDQTLISRVSSRKKKYDLYLYNFHL